MKQCKCGSMAINKDPEKVKCDVCYAYQQGQLASAVLSLIERGGKP